MEFKIVQEKLAKALNHVSKIASGRSTLPILSNVLIRVNQKQVTLTTTNLDMAIMVSLPSPTSNDGVVAVPAKLIAEFVSNLPKGENVEVSSQNDKVTVKAGKYNSVINCSAVDEFPELPEIDETKMTKLTVDIEDFKNSMAQVMIAASNDMTRPALTGVYFNTYEGALYFAATDGYRLTERKVMSGVNSEVAAIVPAASLRGVMGLIDDGVKEIEILFDETQVRFRIGEVEVTSKLIDGSFPDYRQLIPKNSEIKLKINKDDLIRITKLAALFAREANGSITCSTSKENNTITVASVANELGENDSNIETEVNEDGKITLNARFLLDALNALEEKEITFAFSNNLDPIVLRNEKNQDYTHIVMPLRG